MRNYDSLEGAGISRRDVLKLAGYLTFRAAIMPGFASAQSPSTDEPVEYAKHGSREELKVAVTIDDFFMAEPVKNSLLPLLISTPDLKITAFPVGRSMSSIESEIPG